MFDSFLKHLSSGLLLALLSLNTMAQESSLPMAENLLGTYKKLGLNDLGQQKVVLVLVSQPNCSYCTQVKEDILKPMLASGQYTSNTVFQELQINTGLSLRDFTGNPVDTTVFAQRYQAWATPTLLFLGPQGKQLAEKIIGINTLDLYGYYVDEALKKGFSQLNP